MFLFLFYNGTPYLCINQRGALLVLLLCRGKPFFHTASHIFTQSISSEFIVGKRLHWIYLSLYLSYKHEDVSNEQLNWTELNWSVKQHVNTPENITFFENITTANLVNPCVIKAAQVFCSFSCSCLSARAQAPETKRSIYDVSAKHLIFFLWWVWQSLPNLLICRCGARVLGQVLL